MVTIPVAAPVPPAETELITVLFSPYEPDADRPSEAFEPWLARSASEQAIPSEVRAGFDRLVPSCTRARMV